MKDLISKLTFGFLMAQFVPGGIAICSICLLCISKARGDKESIVELADAAVALWLVGLPRTIVFVVLCTGAGMVIHGVHWAVLSYFESFTFRKKVERSNDIWKTFWHGYPIYKQIFLGPVKIVVETLCFLLFGSGIENLATQENVPHIKKHKMEAFDFLQGFYLHFAQFYAHTGYALLVSLICLFIFICRSGPSWSKFFLFLAVYVLTGVFFVLGRIQLTTLFKAERELRENWYI